MQGMTLAESTGCPSFGALALAVVMPKPLPLLLVPWLLLMQPQRMPLSVLLLRLPSRLLPLLPRASVRRPPASVQYVLCRPLPLPRYLMALRLRHRLPLPLPSLPPLPPRRRRRTATSLRMMKWLEDLLSLTCLSSAATIKPTCLLMSPYVTSQTRWI